MYKGEVNADAGRTYHTKYRAPIKLLYTGWCASYLRQLAQPVIYKRMDYRLVWSRDLYVRLSSSLKLCGFTSARGKFTLRGNTCLSLTLASSCVRAFWLDGLNINFRFYMASV